MATVTYTSGLNLRKPGLLEPTESPSIWANYLNQNQDILEARLGNYLITAGTQPAYTITTSPVSFTSYVLGQKISFKIHATHTSGTATLNIDGLGTKNIFYNGLAVPIGFLALDKLYDAVYDGTNIVILDATANPLQKRNSFQIRPTNGTNAWTVWVSNTSVQATPFETRDITDIFNITNTASITKLISATFVAGTGNGGLATGAVAANTTYHFFAIVNPVTGAVDVGYDTSLSATNLLANANVIAGGFTKYRRIRSYLTDASGFIRNDIQVGNEFIFNVPAAFVAGAAQVAGTETLRTLDVPSGLNLKVKGIVSVQVTSGGAVGVYVYSAAVNLSGGLLSSRESQAYGSFSVVDGQGHFEAITNTSSQIRTNSANAGGTPTVNITLILASYEDILLT